MASSAEAPATSSSPSPTAGPSADVLQRPENFSRMKLTLDCGRLDSGSYSHSGLKLLSSKPNLYVETSIDGKPGRKNEHCRATYQPRWRTEYVVPITPYSKLNFKLWDHSSFKRDQLVAEGDLDMHPVLVQNRGRCKDLTVSLDLYTLQPNPNSSSQSPSSSTPLQKTDKKCGELIVILDGLNVDMASLPTPSPKPSINNNTAAAPCEPAAAENGSVPNRNSQVVNGEVAEGLSRLPPLTPASGEHYLILKKIEKLLPFDIRFSITFCDQPHKLRPHFAPFKPEFRTPLQQ